MNWRGTPEERFNERYIPEPNTGCWIWVGGHFAQGYGRIHVEDRAVKAHRFSYELFYGKIEKNLMVCHKCDTPSCVNPKHLFLGTAQDNVDDMMKKGRKKAARGSDRPNTILKIEDISKIIEQCNAGTSQTELGLKYGVSQATICSILRRQTWAYLTGHLFIRKLPGRGYR